MPSMTEARKPLEMIYLSQKIFAVGTSSMDIYDPETRTWTKQSIPVSAVQHCITQISSTQFILTGGRVGTDVSNNVMMKNILLQNCLCILQYKISLQTTFFKITEAIYNLDL